jgi:hypothetical protein
VRGPFEVIGPVVLEWGITCNIFHDHHVIMLLLMRASAGDQCQSEDIHHLVDEGPWVLAVKLNQFWLVGQDLVLFSQTDSFHYVFPVVTVVEKAATVAEGRDP